jgi:hypothetical protein
MEINRKDLGAAAIFALIGGFFAIDSLRKLRIGSAVSMGPGYFPILLSIILLLFAALITLQSYRTRRSAFGVWPWRGIVLILGAPVIFCITIRALGLLPATFLTALLSAFASTKMKSHVAIILSLAIAVFSCLVFIWGVAMPVPVFGNWFEGVF